MTRPAYHSYLCEASACIARARASSDRESARLWLAVSRNWIDAASLARTVNRLVPVKGVRHG